MFKGEIKDTLHYAGKHNVLDFLFLANNRGRQVSRQADMKDSSGRNKLTTLAQMDKEADISVTKSVHE